MNIQFFDQYQDEVYAWREVMDTNLRAKNSWLALYGLTWLEEGVNRLGSDPKNDILLPEDSAPAFMGTIEHSPGKTTFSSEAESTITLNGEPFQQSLLTPDSSEDPSYLEIGSLRMVVIERGGLTGLRIWDNNRIERRTFPGRSWFPVDSEFQVQAEFKEHAAGRTIVIPNILGEQEEVQSLGTVTFPFREFEGQLEAMEAADNRLFIIFKDSTCGAITYPAGRFLVSEEIMGSTVTLDFNRSYNPPCAFTAFATCPLPPEENHLDFPVEAGEKYIPFGPMHS
ncbi:MAG: DUF1684 domain-containing protein [Anaerolineales bacterium]